jgi:hypothetical protein
VTRFGFQFFPYTGANESAGYGGSRVLFSATFLLDQICSFVHAADRNQALPAT